MGEQIRKQVEQDPENEDDLILTFTEEEAARMGLEVGCDYELDIGFDDNDEVAHISFTKIE